MAEITRQQFEALITANVPDADAIQRAAKRFYEAHALGVEGADELAAEYTNLCAALIRISDRARFFNAILGE